MFTEIGGGCGGKSQSHGVRTTCLKFNLTRIIIGKNFHKLALNCILSTIPDPGLKIPLSTHRLIHKRLSVQRDRLFETLPVRFVLGKKLLCGTIKNFKHEILSLKCFLPRLS